jgi:PilZ domain
MKDGREVHMDQKMIFGERRLHARKSCSFAIEIHDYRRSYDVLLWNLSLGGALVECPRGFRPRPEQELLLNIAFRRKVGLVSVKGKIVRVKFDGLGIAFLREASAGFLG